MCTVDKLLIKGIRSFSPDNKDVIEFYKPLTLIVGHNGAGKTTVIECLKQACTGELPPNTRSGQSFIHDPKVAGETEVKAQIKLRFRTSTGQPVVVQRSFQLTQKKLKLEFKSLDSVLQTFNKETGEKQALTYRCADIDRIVPSLMGVSKAVLENVVFVHQEDSNWPLAEGKVLKERFDDIFAATKYTKALKEVRAIQKQKAVDLKLMDKELAHLKTHKDNATKLKLDLEQAKERSRKYSLEIQDLQAQIQEKADAQRPIEVKLSQIDTLFSKLTNLKGELKSKSQEAATRFAELKEGDVEESTEELEDFQARFDELVGQKQAEHGAKVQGIDSKKAEERACTAAYTKEIERQGRLQAAADVHAANIMERDRFVLEAAPGLGMTVPTGSTAGQLPPTCIASFEKAVQEQVSDLSRQLSALKEKHMAEDKALSASVRAKSAELSSVKQSISMQQQSIAKNTNEAERISNQMLSLTINGQIVDEIRAREQEAKENLGHRRSEISALKLGEVVQREQEQIAMLAKRITALREERVQVAETASMSAQLRMKRDDMLVREERFNTQLNSKSKRLCGVLGVAALPEADRMRDTLQNALAGKKTELGAAQEKLRGLQSKHSQAQGELNTVRSQLRQQETRLDQARRDLRAGMLRLLGTEQDEEKYPQSCDMSEKRTEHMMHLTAMAKSMFTVLNTFKNDVEHSTHCPLCTRAFHGNEKQVCLESIAQDLQEIPSQIETRMQELTELQQKASGLKALQPLWHRYSDIKANALPPLQERSNTLIQQLQSLASQVDEQQHVQAVVDGEVQDATRLLQEVVLPLHSQHEELKKVRNEVAFLEAQVRSTGSGRTVADIDNDLDDVETTMRRRERERDEVQKRESKLKEEVLQLQNAWVRLEGELNSAMDKLNRKIDFEERLKGLEESTAGLEAQIRSLTARQEPMAIEHQTLLEQQETAQMQAARAQSSLEAKLREACQWSDQWKQRNKSIQEYEAQGLASSLARCKDQVQSLGSRRQAIVAELEQLDAELASIKDRLAETETERSNIQALVSYRRAKAEEQALQEQEQGITSQIQQVGSIEDLRKGLDDLEHVKGALITKSDELRGARKMKDEEVSTRQRELANNPDFREIEQRYRKKNIEFKTTSMANSDLDKYHKALEKALLTFHTTKMADINKIIKELWQKTYQGQDIDYIQIKADADAQRSYNYRVVMYFGGAELEMRGRCSAGQKVLASLIIRLALAETFCLNCGILALDEPTTNLDADNSAGLAEALRNIISARQDQENFQLLVITHDERFANMIGTREHAENLWRITKDENHHTHVACEQILE